VLGLVVISKDVAAFAPEDVHETVKAPPVPLAEAAEVVFADARYGLDVPTSVTDNDVTGFGAKKSFDAWDFFPIFFPAAIFLFSYFYNYAVRSP